MVEILLGVLFTAGWLFLVLISSTSLVWHVPVARAVAWQAMQIQEAVVDRANRS